MKVKLLATILAVSALCSCKQAQMPIVETKLIDSLLMREQPSTIEKITLGNLSFWKNRLDSFPNSDLFKQQYANSLVQRFYLYGNINDLVYADTLLQEANKAFNFTDAGIQRSLATICISRHQFSNALQYATNALNIGSDKYYSLLIRFDALFELGFYADANRVLKTCYNKNEYGYFFRASKMEHQQGSMDSAISYMLRSAQLAKDSSPAQQAAYSNLADLYMHSGKFQNAYNLYVNNVKTNRADFHSWQGLGRIAMLNDKNDSLAKKIFAYQAAHSKLPDAWYNGVWLAEMKNNFADEKSMATLFADKATNIAYGNMYNKYLIELYTDILNQPEKALALAEKELTNRRTPQTYCWYAWTLHKNHQDAKADDICSKYISGHPLEPLELFYMGKMKKEEGMGYDAKQFLNAAAQNKFDLSPAKEKELDSLLSE